MSHPPTGRHRAGQCDYHAGWGGVRGAPEPPAGPRRYLCTLDARHGGKHVLEVAGERVEMDGRGGARKGTGGARKGAGRPRSEGETRTEKVMLRFAPSELARLRAITESPSTWVHEVAMRAVEDEERR